MTFLYPAMLAGLGALAVPVLFHLIARQRYQVRDFPTIRLLRPDVRSNVFALRLVDVGQLLLRLLVLLLLALAMSRLFAGCLPGSAPRNLLVVVDCSASMRLRVPRAGRGGSTPLIELARERAATLLGELRPPSQCALVAAGHEVAVLAPLGPTAEPTLAALEAVRTTDGGGRGLIEAVARCCDMARRRREARSQIVVLTDLRATAFEARDRLDLERVRAARGELGALLDVVLVDVAGAARDNLAILDARVRGAGPKVGDDAHVVARVANASSEERTAKLRLTVGKRREPLVRRVTLPPGGRADVDLTSRVSRAARAFVEVGLEPEDALAHDNAFCVPLDVADARRVLIVRPPGEAAGGRAPSGLDGLGGAADGRASEAEATLDGARILRLALNPGRELGRAHGTAIHTTLTTPEALAAQPLSTYDVVVLYDVSVLAEQALADLDTFARQGRAVLFVCSGGCNAMKFNRTFATASGKRGALSPAEVGNDRRLEPPAAVALGERPHVLLAPFRDRLRGDLSAVRLARVRDVRRLLDGATVMLRAASGRPLAVERRHGEGRAALLAFGVELDRGNLARTRVFPALVWRLVDYLAGRLHARRPDVVAAERAAALDVSEPQLAFVQELELSRADAATAAPRRLAVSAGRGVLLEGLPAGRYLLHKVQPKGGAATHLTYARHVAVNVDPRESDLTRVPESEVAALFGDGTRVAGLGEDAGLAVAGGELWSALTVVLLLAYAAEAAMGWALSARREKQRAQGVEP